MTTISFSADCQLQRIVFWEPCISPHKSDFLSAVAVLLPEVEIICCADQDLQEERKALGWSASQNERVKIIISPNAERIKSLVIENSTKTLHVFSGTRHLSTLVLGLKAVKSCAVRFAIMSEPRVFGGWKGKLRFLQSWLTEGWLRKNCEFVLAIGRNGPPWFKSVGYDTKKIFPFAYFVPPPNFTNASLRAADKSFNDSIIRVGYVGRLVAMKGIFDLVKAVHQLGNQVHLTIVGAGPDENELRQLCFEYRIKADFIGVLPIHSIGDVLEQIDVLVLASTSKDGWGVVVSEALMSGAAVVASNCVGASILLDDPLFGCIVPPSKPAKIANAINKLNANAALTNQNRLERQLFAKSSLSSEAGAYYFAEILRFQFSNGDRPIPFYMKYRKENL